MTASSLPGAAKPEHLTKVLRRTGMVGAGRVRDVEVLSSVTKLRSHTLRVGLKYEGPAADAPISLIIKTGHLYEGRPAYANRHEIGFYRNVASALPERLVPHCFETVDATEASSWHLLLEDLTDSHFLATEHPLPPTFPQCRSMMRAWGLLHAALWDNSRLSGLLGRSATTMWAQYFQSSADRFAGFMDRFGEVMPAERRSLFERLLASATPLLARFDGDRNLTLMHGDAHWWNCFLPRNEQQEQVRILDWEDWTIGTGTTDLAYMMAMLWFPDRRRRIEQPLLDLYHEVLVEQGVTAYSRQMLNEDYRRSVLLLMLRPIWQATNNLPARVWWPNLERNMLAVEDLNCRELLG